MDLRQLDVQFGVVFEERLQFGGGVERGKGRAETCGGSGTCARSGGGWFGGCGREGFGYGGCWEGVDCFMDD